MHPALKSPLPPFHKGGLNGYISAAYGDDDPCRRIQPAVNAGVEVADAAKRKSLDEIVLKSNPLVQACVACHVKFRQKVLTGLK